MTRPRIKRTTEQIETPNGDLYLLRPSAGADIQIENPDAEGRRLLAALDGSLDARRAGGALRRGGRQRPARAARGAGPGRGRRGRRPDPGGDDRALRPPDPLLRRHHHRAGRRRNARRGSKAPASSSSASAASAAGSALSLACCGVGEMLLVDGDRVEESNLNRQILYTEARHRPAQGRGRGGAAPRLQLAHAAGDDRRAVDSEESIADADRRLRPGRSTRPTGPRMKSSSGATAPASRRRSRTSR